MNKDVIYVEPEDDITDIITKIEGSKEKIVALVPPKKAELFHSVVNIKLITKAGINADKNIVLVTTDPSVTKLAAYAHLPITKDLKTAPVIPTVEEVKAEPTEKAEIVEKLDDDVEEADDDDDDDDDTADESDDNAKEDGEDEKSEKDDKTEEKDEKGAKAEKPGKEDKKAKKEKGEKKPGKGFFGWIKNHKIWTTIICILIVLLPIVLVWAFVIAPAVDIKVTVRTVKNNFSENVTFTTKLDEENLDNDRFYLEEKKVDNPIKVEFKATGSKNIGEKATGEVVVYAYFKGAGGLTVKQGSAFTINNLSYTANEDVNISWQGTDINACSNAGQPTIVLSGCLIYSRVPVTAVGSGASYNIGASDTGWTTTAGVGVYSDGPMEGGTDKTITIVTQADVDTAVESLASSNVAENKALLLNTINDEDNLIIESSFNQTVGEVKVTPAVGEEVKEGDMPNVSSTVTTSVYILDLTRVKEYITKKAKVSETNRIYSLGDPFLENFTKIENGYIGKIKATYLVGPNISEQSILESVKGIRVGNIKPTITGTSEDVGNMKIEIGRSFPWVNTVPTDPNKINIEIITEE